MATKNNDIELLISARDESGKVLKAFVKSADKVIDSLKSATDVALENDAVLNGLNTQYSKLQKTMSDLTSVQKLVTNLQKARDASKASVESFTKLSESLKEQKIATSEAAKNAADLKEEWLESKKTLDTLTTARKKDNEAIVEARDNTRRLNELQKASAKELALQEKALTSITREYKKASAVKVRDVKATQELSEAARKAGVNIDDLANEHRKLNKVINDTGSELNSTRSKIKQYDKAVRDSTTAVEKQGKAVKETSNNMSLFDDKSRKAMSVTQRLRGEVLSITAAYVGLYGVISNIGDSFKAYSAGQAAQAKFTAVFKDDAQAVAAEMDFIGRTADNLGLDLKVLRSTYADFFVAASKSGETGADIREMFLGIAESASVMKLSTDDLQGAMRAMIQIMSKGVVQSEELQGQLAERFPGAVATFANAMEREAHELKKMMELGQLTSKELLLFTMEAAKEMEGGLDTATTSLVANFNRLGNTVTRLRERFGEVAESDVNDALRELNDLLSGEGGAKLVDAMAKAFLNLVKFTTWVVDNLETVSFWIKALIGYQLAKVLYGWGVAANTARVSIGALAVTMGKLRAALIVLGPQIALFVGATYLIDWALNTEQTLDDLLNKVRRWGEEYIAVWKHHAKMMSLELKYAFIPEFAYSIPDELNVLRGQAEKELSDTLKAIQKKYKKVKIAEDGGEAPYSRNEEEELQRRLAEEIADNKRKAARDRETAEVAAKADSKLQSEFEKVTAALAKLSADSIDKQIQYIDDQYSELIANLTKAGRLNDVVAVEEYKNLLKAQVIADEELAIAKENKRIQDERLSKATTAEKEVNRLLDTRKSQVEEISRLRERGDSASETKANQIEESFISLDDQIRKSIDNAITFYEKLGTDEAQRAIDGLNAVKATFDSTTSDMLMTGTQVRETIADGLTNSVTEFAYGISDAISGVGSLSDAFNRASQSFTQFASNFLIQIGQMILKAAILKAMQGSGLGGITGIGLNHTGGMVGQSGMSRMVDPSIFASAARYHTGGLVGLKPNEVPIIAENTEEVLTRSDPRHRLNGGLGSGTKVEIIDQRGSDAPEVQTTRSSSDGMETIKVLIRDTVKSELNNGSMDTTMAQFGSSRRGSRR